MSDVQRVMNMRSRKRAQGAAWLISVALVVAPFELASSNQVAVVAVVNGEPITNLELRDRVELMRARAAERSLSPEALQKEALQSLIEDRLIQYAAKRFGIVVKEAELEEALQLVAARNRMSREQLRQALAEEGISWERFRKEVRMQLLVRRLKDHVVQGEELVSDAELEQFLAAMPELRARFAAEAAGLEQVRVRHILLKSAPGVRDEVLRTRLALLKERILQGASFADLARSYSEDTSAASGGDLGWVLPGELAPEFEEVLTRLKPGALSDPVKTRLGWHLIEVLERRALADDPEALRNYARQKLRERKRNQAFAAFLQSLEAEAVIERFSDF